MSDLGTYIFRAIVMGFLILISMQLTDIYNELISIIG